MPFTCLLIDDDPDDREIFGIALEDVDRVCRYIATENGVDALELLEDSSFIPNFIFLDLNMPLMDGKECLREIKKIPHLNHIPVIIYSTSSYQKDVEETRLLGANHFLTKPSSIKALTTLLTEILTQKDLPFFLKA